MTSPLPPVPDDLSMDPRWRAWFRQLYVYLSSSVSGGGGLVPNSREVNTTAPLAGGGDLGSDLTLSLSPGGVTYSYLQDVSATNKILGRSGPGSGDVEEIDCTSAGRALLDDADASAQQRTLKLSRAKLDFIYG